MHYDWPTAKLCGSIVTVVTESIVVYHNFVTAHFFPDFNSETVNIKAIVGNKLYSPLMSSAQRLPNGNTLITEGNNGRIFEVTAEFQTVWEYVNPYYGKKGNQNIVYRAYRVPYEWIPQL